MAQQQSSAARKTSPTSTAGAEESSSGVVTYQHGFGNHFETEALPNSLPPNRNNPLECPYGLYAEQISGTAFTRRPRSSNLRSWLYRVRPSVSGYEGGVGTGGGGGGGPPYRPYDECPWFGRYDADSDRLVVDPNPLRWKPMPVPPVSTRRVTFLSGTRTLSVSGDVSTKSGLAIHLYAFNSDMTSDRLSMYNSDGDFLFVPQLGTLAVKTEMGTLVVAVGEICVVPRGVVFSVDIAEEETTTGSGGGAGEEDGGGGGARGYILEIYKGHFDLPELGPIGSNGLANPRDFRYPVAAFDDAEPGDRTKHTVVNKFCHRLFARRQNHSPYNVVAWHGNYAPFKYDLNNFNTMNSVSYDHPDPSIYTVLTAQSDEVSGGTALADFVVFPPRWMVMERTFRPPYFHRNAMSEYMGVISGHYDAKGGDGFGPGCGSLHNVMTPHGPDAKTVRREEERAAMGEEEGERPVKFDGGMAFMFETSHLLRLTPYAVAGGVGVGGEGDGGIERDVEYATCWEGIPRRFPR